jgi:hypothetical protein
MPTEIALATEFFAPVRTGRKTQTTRRGRRDVALGPARFSDDAGNVQLINVDRVSYLRFRDLETADAVKDGFASKDELRDAMVKFYPDFSDDEEVTIIIFTPALDYLER